MIEKYEGMKIDPKFGSKYEKISFLVEFSENFCKSVFFGVFEKFKP